MMKKFSFFWAFIVFLSSFLLSFTVSVSALTYTSPTETQVTPDVLQANINTDIENSDLEASESAEAALPA